MFTTVGSPVRPGDVLAGKYCIGRILGEGGMGVVVAARHLQLDQIVALKFLRPEVIANPEALDRFMREARNAVRLRSEHVARIIDVGTLDSGAPYIVMEYLEGNDLANVLAQRRTLPISVAVDFVLQACDAIAEAHARGIVHRDLKPQNLFVTRRHDGTDLVKVLDFGISKSLAGGDFAATASQTVMGSPAYMSPEQMRSAKFVDGRTDVWALGVILYQLVIGHVPWKAEGFTELCFKIAADPLPAFPDTQPPRFEEVVRRCLEKDPNSRLSDVYALAVALLPFAPAHAQPLVESIGRVLRGQVGKRDAIPTVVGRVLQGQAGERDAMSTIAIAQSTLREATGQSVKRKATGSRQRRVTGVVAAIGVLAGFAVTVVALGGGRSGESGDLPTSLPLPDRAAAQPHPVHASPPVAASPPPPPVSKSEPLTTHEATPAVTPPTKVEPPPPPVSEPELPTTHEATSAATPPTKFEPLPAPGAATNPHDKVRHRDLSIAAPTKPHIAAPATAPPLPVAPQATKPTAESDLLSSPD